MLEPGDVRVSVQSLIPGPGPLPEPPDSVKGKPQFKSRYRNQQRKKVGETYEETITMNGEREITIVFAEQYPNDVSNFKPLAEFTIGNMDAGFRLSFQVERRHYAGMHHFRYRATNSKGTVLLDRTLIIEQQTVGG